MPATIKPEQKEGDAKRVEILRSEEVQEIISYRPGFFVRSGMLIFLIVLIAMAVASWFIRYPDIIMGNARLNGVNTPKAIITRSEGKLMKILVKESDTVQTGQVLAYMESIANPQAVAEVRQQLDTINSLINQKRTDEITRFFPDYTNQQFLSNLGELQEPYQVFIQSFTSFRDFLSSGFFLRKRNMLGTDMQNIQKLHEILANQKVLMEQDVSLSSETFKASESLAQEKVISALDYRNEKSKLLAKQLSLPQINASIIANEGQQNEKRKEIAELENQIVVQKSSFVQALQTMKSRVQEWEQKYVLKTPVAGRLLFASFFQENQEVKVGKTLFYVQPGNTSYFVEMLVPQFNSGKVKPGQEVLLKFQAYPFEEYGAVTGRIEYVSNMASDSGYMAKVSLPAGLVTTYHKSLQFRDGLVAQADIITEDRRLLERFYHNIVKKMK